MTPRPAEHLTRPIVLIALAVLLLNDHLLKAEAPGLLTGKLSDLAGLVAAPFVVAATVEIGLWLGDRPVRHSMRRCVAATAAVIGVFTAVKVVPQAASAYGISLAWLQSLPSSLVDRLADAPRHALAPAVVMTDPSDLLMVPIAVAIIALELVARRGSADRNDNAAGRRDPAALTWTVISWATGLRAWRS